MSHILYILVVNCDQMHLENSKISLENSLDFFSPKRVGILQRYWYTL